MRLVARLPLLVAGLMVLGVVAAAPASATESWWQLSSSARPGKLQPGAGADEVQRLTVEATSGDYRIADEDKYGTGNAEPVFAPFDATHQELQALLEEMYGTGNVEVTKGNGFGTEPYEIVWKGELADEYHQALAVQEGAARDTEVTRGKPDGEIVLLAENLGDAPVEGEQHPVTIADKLPAGLEAISISAWRPKLDGSLAGPTHEVRIPCSLQTLTCTLESNLPPYLQVEVRIAVRVAGAHSGEDNEASISGGGAPPASISHPIVVSNSPTPFAVQDYRLTFEEEGGTYDTQAGSHPFQATGTVAITEGPDALGASEELGPDVEPAALAKDVVTKLPPGFLGNPTTVPTCTIAQFLKRVEEIEDECSPQSAIGVASATVNLQGFTHQIIFTEPLFNLEPYAGEPARFGFYIPVSETAVVLDTSLRTGPGEGAIPGQSEDYGVNVTAHNISQTGGLLNTRVTIWGTPGDPRHDASRGWGCLAHARGAEFAAPCNPSDEPFPPAFLTLPTSCTGPLQTSVEADPWDEPGAFQDTLAGNALPALDGCNRLPFSPTVQAQPTTDSASSPSGLDVNVDFHDEGLTSSNGLAESQLKNTTVTLPEGFTINPSAGVGLVGCTPADFARETLESAPGAGCPNESKLGTVEIETPLLKQAIHGSLYVAQPYENPFDSLVALYVVAKSPETGVLIKLAGKVTPNPVTGQLVTSFEDTPQLPFSHFNFHFREGQQAPLISPPTCGTYTTSAELAPWSEPFAPVTENASFEITSGVGGGPCPSGGAPAFNPGIQSGTINNNAGAFSAFDLHLTRGDGDQEISTFSTDLPPGLAGILTGIPYCPEADIALARTKTGRQEEAEPSCPAASKVGHSLVGTGVGAVLAYTPGQLYLAGPYDGDPFSLVSVTSAVVGPFDLGTVVIRFGLRIDPHTAQVSVDPTASEPIPHIIDGIVTHVRDIRVYVDRPGFIFNPTSCEPMAISSTLGGNAGASTTISSPFQAASCASLKFNPSVSVTTAAKASKANGASLKFKISYPGGAMGKETWFNEAKFTIPRQLPARLTTLQQACLATVFETDRSACPAASRIGTATVRTQVLPVPLEGPVYFVSYGGAKFPDAVLDLTGDGVHIELHGETFISEGVTSATFRNTPDVPFESIEVNVPTGPYSEFGVNLPHERYDFCGQKISMPVFFKGADGAQMEQTIPVGVTGCPTTMSISSHKVKGRALTLTVYVPGAGKLKATATGLSTISKNASGPEYLTLTLEARKNKGFVAKVTLSFIPRKGSRQARSIRVRI